MYKTEMVNGEEYITIPKKYLRQLERDSQKLSSLVNAGVDNWVGYDLAMEMYHEEFGEEE